MAEAAVEAFAGFAVVAAELEEGLAGEGAVAVYAALAEEACDIVLLGREGVEYVDGALLHGDVGVLSAIGIEDWGYDVDYEYVGGVSAQGSGGAPG